MPQKIKEKTKYMETGEDYLGGYIKSDNDFAHGDPNSWTPRLWSWIIQNLEIKSIIDVGCGEGHSTAFFSKLGCRALGIEGSQIAIKNSPVKKFIKKHDYTKCKFVPKQKYDAVWCCEFVEHVEEKCKQNFLTTFGSAEKYVFITHALPGQKGWHHVNCKKKSYWINEMDKIGYNFDPFLTKTSRCIAEIGHFKNTGLVFTKKNAPHLYDADKLKIPELSVLSDRLQYKIYKLKIKFEAVMGKMGEILRGFGGR